MEENQNPTPPVSENSNQSSSAEQNSTPTVIPTSRDPVPSNTNPIKLATKFPLKITLVIIIFLLLAGGAAASFTVFKPQLMSLISKPTPTPTTSPLPTEALAKEGTLDPKADWKTYTNDGFSFKYPQELEIKQNNSTEFVLSGFPLPEISLKKQKALFNKPQASSIPNTTGAIRSVEEAEINVDGKILKKYVIFYNLPDSDIAIAQFQFNGNYYEFKMGISAKGLPTLFEQILSTFKFTDTKTVDTSNWKTYENKIGQYSFEYPNSLKLGKEENPTAILNSATFYTDDYKEEIEEFGMAIPKVRLGSSLYIRTEKNDNFTNDESYIKFQDANPSRPTAFKEKKQLTITGEKWLFIGSVYAFETHEYYLSTYANGRTYDIQFRNVDENYDLLDQILSTFRFD